MKAVSLSKLKVLCSLLFVVPAMTFAAPADSSGSTDSNVARGEEHGRGAEGRGRGLEGGAGHGEAHRAANPRADYRAGEATSNRRLENQALENGALNAGGGGYVAPVNTGPLVPGDAEQNQMFKQNQGRTN